MPVTGNIRKGLPTLAGLVLRLRDVEGIVLLAGRLLVPRLYAGCVRSHLRGQARLRLLDPRQEVPRHRRQPGSCSWAWLPCRRQGPAQPWLMSWRRHRSARPLRLPPVPNARDRPFGRNLEGAGCRCWRDAIFGLFDFEVPLHVAREPDGFDAATSIAIMGVLLSESCKAFCSRRSFRRIPLWRGCWRPHVALLGRIPGTKSYPDLARHPETRAAGGRSLLLKFTALCHA